MKLTKKNYTSFDVIKIPLKQIPFLTGMYFIIVILMAVLPTTILAISTAHFIDTAIKIFNHHQMIASIYVPFIYLVVIIILSSLLNPTLSYIEAKISLHLEQKILPELVKMQAQLPYYYIENAQNWELIDRITDEMEQTFIEGLQGYATLVKSIVSIISVVLYLVFNVWWSALLLFIVSIPFYILSIYWGKRAYETKVQTHQYERAYSYYSDEILLSRNAKDERTVFNYFNAIIKKYYDNFVKSRDIELNVLFKSMLSMKMIDVLLIVISIITLIMVASEINKAITVGMFIGLASALFSMADNLGWSIQNAIKKIAEAQEYMKELTSLMMLEKIEDVTDKPSDKLFGFESLEFNNVWFKYPNADEYILKGISFKMEAGNHYAFVGINGSGKTTITKLLTKLYTTYEGTILINGKNLNEYTSSEIKAIFSVVYQDFGKYQVPLAQNIYFGDYHKKEDEEKLYHVLDKIELLDFVSKLPNGVKSDLGKLATNSLELSGGQWQKIAIARSLYSCAPIKILDEPTAALDPIVESKIYHNFSVLMQGKTSILITHRLGATKLVDEIFVISDGIVKEKGSHNQLMCLDGIYANMYLTQKRWYNE